MRCGAECGGWGTIRTKNTSFCAYFLMSNLRKSIASRSKNNLEAVYEDGSQELVEETTSLSVNDESDDKLMEHFKHIKSDTFPIIEQYELHEATLQTYYRPPSKEPGAILVCHHGAGSSALTFCQLTRYLMEEKSNQNPSIGVFAFDARGHGNSIATDNYSLEKMTSDFGDILDQFVKKNKISSTLYLVGHSLGGSVLTNYLQKNQTNPHNIKGLVMLDIVEETANSALSAMPMFIAKRPAHFATYTDAINWHVKTNRLLHNVESAKISVPALLTKSNDKLVWITDLQLTAPYWGGWFTNLSSNFIECGKSQKSQKVAKLLILAGHETLDTNLIIGQMQGKYQLIVFNNSEKTGHFVHEDIPMQVGLSLIDFIRRNDSPSDYMKNELGFVPKWGAFNKG
ncbi:hypothetical protein PGUG_04937 [Meyerozyma guilliermondii ATCC 6260]|uniref:Protein phosphatase methylesterase 1 n=1 Tax=Meyerozyma guilliermondii (strain ATCC 6260 / CBS 566 / DSM 6381 / JCM 1539 / NBRC 10279 / NRRL Y-324) TaxID=294746 RepID=A5DNT6_PICGU|nr:uncharacterized protein PGUG_04937 [Meyerozyma guilliermondii ATCC 6260]EDK40839.2 hypothetical protein PGUG_04937 [Meyerozyma guilliermondii ATCC 6260]